MCGLPARRSGPHWGFFLNVGMIKSYFKNTDTIAVHRQVCRTPLPAPNENYRMRINAEGGYAHPHSTRYGMHTAIGRSFVSPTRPLHTA